MFLRMFGIKAILYFRVKMLSSISEKIYGTKVPFGKEEEMRFIIHFAFHIKQMKTPSLQECKEFAFLEETFSSAFRPAKSVQDKVRSVIMKCKCEN